MENLDNGGGTKMIFFITEETIEAILGFSQETMTLFWY